MRRGRKLTTDIVVAIIVRAPNEFLMLEKADESLKHDNIRARGLSTFPGGRVPDGMTPEEAVAVKAHEDAGLVIDKFFALGTITFPHKGPAKTHFYIGVLPADAEIKIDPKCHKSQQWATVDRMPRYIPEGNEKFMRALGKDRFEQLVYDALDGQDVTPEQLFEITVADRLPADSLPASKTHTRKEQTRTPAFNNFAHGASSRGDDEFDDGPQPKSNANRSIGYILRSQRPQNDHLREDTGRAHPDRRAIRPGRW